MSGQEIGAPGLLLQFLAWVEAKPRSYGETMDAWRTSCPRLSVWEDAVGDGLVAVDSARKTSQGEALVHLTEHGRARLVH